MTYDVLIRQTNDHYTATVLGLPDCVVEAPTRAEAIRRAYSAAADFIAEGELIRIEIAPRVPPRPLKSFAGMWANDETFEDFVTAINDYRRELESDPSQP